jgi:putative hemolysin
MTSRSFAALMAGFGLFVVFAAPASAIDKPNKPAPAQPTKMSPTKLSESECTQLGGKVSTEELGVCNSHRVCQTKDENGKSHAVCINSR